MRPLQLAVRTFVMYNLWVQLAFLAVSIAAVALYVAETYVDLGNATQQYTAAFLVVFLVDFVSDNLGRPRPLVYLLRGVVLFDLLSMLPYSLALAGIHWAYLLNCLLFLRLYKISKFCKRLRMLRIVRFRDFENKADVNWLRALIVGLPEVGLRIAELLANIVAFFMFSASLLYSLSISDRNSFTYSSPGPIHWFGLLYFTVVTTTTVGYGDITPTTSLSRAVVLIMIIFGFTFIPLQLTFLAQKLLFGERSKTYVFRERDAKLIFVLGVADYGFVKGLLLEVFHPTHKPAIQTQSKKLRLVFLSVYPPCEDVKQLLSLPQFKYSFEYHIGSAKNPLDLLRIGIENGHAIIVLRDTKNYLDAKLTDQARPRVITLLPYTAKTKVVLRSLRVDVIMAVEELKYKLIGLGSAVPGALGLFFHLNQTQSSFSTLGRGKLWHRVLHEFYETDKVGIHQLRLSILPADAAFLHLSFRDAVLQLFRISEGKVLLVAVVGKDGVNVVQINPASNLRLRDCSEILVIAPSIKVATDAIVGGVFCESSSYPSAGTDVESGGGADIDAGICPADADSLYSSLPLLSSRTLLTLRGISSVYSGIESAHCKAQNAPLDLASIRGHYIIILVAAEADVVPVDNLLAAVLCIVTSLRMRGRRPVLVLTKDARAMAGLANEIFGHVDAALDGVHFVFGHGSNPEHLSILKIASSRGVIVVNPKSCRAEHAIIDNERLLADEQVIIASLQLGMIGSASHTVAELVYETNSVFLRASTRPRDLSRAWIAQSDPLSEDFDVTYCPLQSSGQVLADVSLEALLIQTIFSPALLSFWESIVSGGLLQKFKVPTRFVGLSLSVALEALVKTDALIVVGVARRIVGLKGAENVAFVLVTTSNTIITLTEADELFAVKVSSVADF